MKTRIVIGSLVATMMTFQVLARQAENDDMYFNSKDRQKLKVENAATSANDKIDSDYKAFKKKHFDENQEEAEIVNPTDSYSARTINPEYISRSNSEQASEDEQNYYVEGYTPSNTFDSYSSSTYNNNNNWNNSNGYNGNNYYGYGSSPYNSWNSPYGSCGPGMSPYYSGGSGWTLSFGYMWGSPGWNYGMNYGWGNSYYNPYGYGYNPYGYSYYSPYSNYGYPYYYGGSESSGANYGKRPSRHSAVVTPTPRSAQGVTSNTNGRTNGRSRQTEEYYVKPSRRTTTLDNSSRERYTRSTARDYPATRTWDSDSSTPGSSSAPASRPAYTPTKSSGSSGSSSEAARSSGSSTPRPRSRD